MMDRILMEAAAALPDHAVASPAGRRIIRHIAGEARRRLGRPARRSRQWLDVTAVEAVRRVATEVGIPRVAQWAAPGMSLTAMARSLVRRAVEAGLYRL